METPTNANRPAPAPPGPNPMETLLGASQMTVHTLAGATEPVQIRVLPIRSYPDYLEAQLDEPGMVELLCGRPAGWADTLTLDSIERIVAEGDRLNADFFGRWLRRRLERQERLLPGSTPAAGRPSPTPSPTSPPPPANPSPASRT